MKRAGGRRRAAGGRMAAVGAGRCLRCDARREPTEFVLCVGCKARAVAKLAAA